MPRRRIVDWHTPDGIDPDTPVVDLHDQDDAGRDGLVMFSDEERATLAWLCYSLGTTEKRRLFDRALRLAHEREEVVRMRAERTRWRDRAWAHAAIIIAAVAALNLPEWVRFLRGQ